MHSPWSPLQVILVIFFLAIHLIPSSTIVRKAGFSHWWGLFGIIPIANIVMLWVFAFISWPVCKTPGPVAANV